MKTEFTLHTVKAGSKEGLAGGGGGFTARGHCIYKYIGRLLLEKLFHPDDLVYSPRRRRRRHHHHHHYRHRHDPLSKVSSTLSKAG